MKNRKYYILTVLLLITGLFYSNFTKHLYAEENPKQTDKELQTLTQERENDLEQQLLLDLPETTDNPNHVITFKDPSGKGVQLSIDGSDFETIKSPYILPSLGIGKHQLLFQFYDKEETLQSLEKILYVLPRPPVINPPIVEKKDIKISGTSLPDSEVTLLLSNSSKLQQYKVMADKNGIWSLTIEKNLQPDKYMLIAFTRKRGYNSAVSEPIFFVVQKKERMNDKTVAPPQKTESQDWKQRYLKLTLDVYKKVRNDKILLILIGIDTILSILIGLFIHKILTRKTIKKAKTLVEDSITKEEKELTIKEQLEQAGLKVGKTTKESQQGDEITSTKTKKEKEKGENTQAEKKKERINKEDINDVIENVIKENSIINSEKKTSLFNKLNILERLKTVLSRKKFNKKMQDQLEANLEEVDIKINEIPPKKIKKEKFLKDFKEFDPDDENEQETDEQTKSKKNNIKKDEKKKNAKNPKKKRRTKKKQHKNIKITLTSEGE